MKRYPPKPLPYDADGDAIFDEAFSVASITECTGLIPSAPASGAEADSYSDIYDVPWPRRLPMRFTSCRASKGDGCRKTALISLRFLYKDFTESSRWIQTLVTFSSYTESIPRKPPRQSGFPKAEGQSLARGFK